VGVIAAAGAAIGELTGYLAGVAGQAVIENRQMHERLERLMRRYGLLAIFVLAAIPNPFFDVAGIIAGALRFPVQHFLLSAWAGKTVKFLAIAYLGAGTAQLFEQLIR
jgi:membrane protein YqaA with SNARE-associated domain